VQRLEARARTSTTHRDPIHGGDFDSFSELLADVKRTFPSSADPHVLDTIAHHHGSEHTALARLIAEDASLGGVVHGTRTLAADVVNAARTEMAMTLSDVVFRRTGIGTGDIPSRPTVESAAAICGAELGWSAQRRQAEIDAVMNELRQAIA
jgi:glycerol-3-phosphate dehydrogenase